MTDDVYRAGTMRILAILLLVLCSCTPKDRPWFEEIETSLSADTLDTHYPTDRESAVSLLLGTNLFDYSVGMNGGIANEVRAFRILMEEPERRAIFIDILERAELAGKLYALCALYRLDREVFDREIEEFATTDQKVLMFSGCLLGLQGVALTVQHPHGIRLSAGQTLDEWYRENPGAPRHADIRGGAISEILLSIDLESPGYLFEEHEGHADSLQTVLRM